MNEYERTITIFLVDGTPDGGQTCEISNWTGKSFRIPRHLLKETYGRPELESA